MCVYVCVCLQLLYQIPLCEYMRRWFNRPVSLPLLHLSSKGQQLPAQPIPLFYLKRIAVLMCMLKQQQKKNISSFLFSASLSSFLYQDLLITRVLLLFLSDMSILMNMNHSVDNLLEDERGHSVHLQNLVQEREVWVHCHPFLAANDPTLCLAPILDRTFSPMSWGTWRAFL